MRSRRLLAPVALLALLPVLGAAAGCVGKDPAERVDAIRSRHQATLNGWIVREEPAPVMPAEPPPADGAEDVGASPEPAAAPSAGDAAGAATTDSAPAVDPMTPVAKDILLDVVLSRSSDDTLPGLTLDVTHADAHGTEKAVHKVWVDTSSLPRGPGTQVTHILEGVPYAPGDRFHVEVRSPIPAAERGEYREFAAATP